MDNLSSSMASSHHKRVAVSFIANLRDSLFKSESVPRKVTFKTLFGILVFHLGWVLYRIVITVSGFFPTIVVLSHIAGFILERCLDILEARDLVVRLTKFLMALLEISVLVTYCYFLIIYIYAPVFFVFVDFVSLL